MKIKSIILPVFILLKFILSYYLISSEYDLHRDEYLHLDQANHLAWGYLSVPPVTSWISWLIKLLGNAVFWVKFFPALFGALTMLIVWKAIEELKGNLFSQILGVTCVLFSSLLRLNLLYQPNSLDVLCWTVFYFILIKYVHSENKKWIFIGAFIFAIGFLNKYNFAFLLIGLLPALILSKQRKVFLRKEFYLALLVGFILVLPNLVWQYTHSFPVFHHLKELAETQLVNVNRWDFLKEQLLFFIGGLFVIILSLVAFWAYEPFKKFKFFFWALFFTLGVFVFLKAKGYYAIGLYPIYLAFGSVYLSHILANGWKRYLKPVALAIPVLFFIPIYRIAFPNKSPQFIMEHSKPYEKFGLLRWEDGKNHSLPQDFADMLGWKELAEKVENSYNNLPADENTFILCDNYGQAGAINYYVKNKNIIAVSFNADYLNWFNLDTKIDNFIRVKELGGSESEIAETGPYFETATFVGEVTNSLAREYGTKIFVFKNPKIDVNKKLNKEVEKEIFESRIDF
ncbi:MAG: glycosyltransferase family 39 protein [Pelobium sp.]